MIVARLALDTRLEVGKLGTLDFKAGFYVYAGSARGPGGLAARIGHHLKKSRKPHWHMDYLGRHAEIVEAWFCLANQSCEHAFAEILGRSKARPSAVVGFGCSDCKCPAHLYRFDAMPDFDAFEKQWNGNARGGASRLKRVCFCEPLVFGKEH